MKAPITAPNPSNIKAVGSGTVGIREPPRMLVLRSFPDGSMPPTNFSLKSAKYGTTLLIPNCYAKTGDKITETWPFKVKVFLPVWKSSALLKVPVNSVPYRSFLSHLP